MSSLQRFLLAILPRSWGQAIEKDSRLWMCRCLRCGSEQSIWDAGGVRYRAAGRPRKLVACPVCGPAWHELYKKE